MRNHFPNAKVTAIDYSEESIRIAKEYQNANPEYANIRFEVGDLTVETSKWVNSEGYDFISCHGVMTYIPDAQRVFDLFAKCLSKEGILYIGVNGVTHFGVKIRKSFEYCGHNSNKFDNTLETRRLVELFDRLLPDQTHVATGAPSYIDSDVLNTFSLNLTLPEWAAYAERSGLHFISSAELIPGLSKTLSPNIFPLLFPKSRKELCELIEINNNATFHRLVFCKSAPLPIPWYDLDALLDCEFQTTWLYSIQKQFSDIYGELFLTASIANESDTNFRWSINDLTLKLLQQKQGSCKLKIALRENMNAFKDNSKTLLIKLFMFYQLGIIKIFPDSSEQDSDSESQITPTHE